MIKTNKQNRSSNLAQNWQHKPIARINTIDWRENNRLNVMLDRMQIPTIDSSNIHNFFYGKDSRWLQPNTPFEFYIDRVEDMIERLTDAYPLPPHRKTVTGFFFLTKGNSRRSKCLKEYDFGDNQFFFSPAHQITSVEYISKDAKGYYVQFHDDIFRNLSLYRILEDFPFLDSLANPIVTIPREKSAPILEILKRLEKLQKELGKDVLGLVTLYLVTLMTELKQFVINDIICTKDSAARITKEYKKALTRHIYEKRTVREYADYLSVTPNHLNKCVKSTLNKTARSLLKEVLIREAKCLLKNSNLTVSEIADQLCDQTPSNFVRFFKSHTGLTPKEYVNSSVTAR